MRVVGLDLAGVPTNPTGFASLSDRAFETRLVYPDDEILDPCTRDRPAAVAIDAPLSLPLRGNLRQADASLIARGFRVFPPTFAGMKALTARGMRIADELRAKGIKVIEIHPRTSGAILFGSPDRQVWVSELQKGGWKLKSEASEHEIDAIVAALTGWLWLRGKSEAVGNSQEGVVVIPRGRL